MCKSVLVQTPHDREIDSESELMTGTMMRCNVLDKQFDCQRQTHLCASGASASRSLPIASISLVGVQQPTALSKK